MKRIGLRAISFLFLCLNAIAQPAGAPVLLTPPSAQIAETAGSVTILVTAPAAVAWAAQVQPEISWLAIAGASAGTGNGSIALRAASNAAGASRTGVVLVGGTQFTLRQKGTASAALVTLSQGSLTFGEGTGIADVAILTDSTSGAVPSNGGAPWFTVAVVSPGLGDASSSLRLSVQANTSPSSRTGQATYGDASVQVVQAPFKAGYQNVLAGVVRDSATGQPIAGARLFFYGSGYAYATADSNGLYSVTGTDINSFGGALSGNLYAGSAGYFEASVAVPDLASQVSLPLISDLALQPGGTIVRGTIRDSLTNAPIAGAAITFYRSPQCSYRGGGTQESVTSASDGTYVIDSSYFNESGLTSGFSLNIQVNATGYLGATRGVATFSVYPRNEDIVLTPTSGAVLKGRVIDRATGLPIAGARLFFYGSGYGYATADSSGNYSFRGQDLTSFGGGLSGTLYAGSAGYFESSAVVPDLGSQPSLPVVRDLTLQPGGTIVRGTIRDSLTNGPVAGAAVTFYRSPQCSYRGGGTQESVTSASDGTYAIDSSYFNESGLTSGFSLTIQVNATGYLGATRSVPAFTVFPRAEAFSLVSYIRLDPSSASVAGTLVSGSFTVTLQGPYAGLSWSATTPSNWITISSVQQTSTGGAVLYSVNANHTGQARNGEIDVSVNTGGSSTPAVQKVALGRRPDASAPHEAAAGARFLLSQTVASSLTIASSHSGNFTQGQSGEVYSVVVSNATGASSTSGTVTVTDVVPSGLTLVAMAGAGWTCPGTTVNNCTRSDVLSGGASYPPITVTVNVAANATSPQVNSVTVSSGGSTTATATDSTTIGLVNPAVIASPTPGSTLSGTSVSFSWNSVTGTDQYWLDVGSSVGSGGLWAGALTATSQFVSSLPCDGRTLYVQLYTHLSGAWLTPQRYTYTAPTGCSAQITSPTPGSALTSTTGTFTWSTFSGADQYWLDVGNTVARGDISAGPTTGTSQTVNGLPCDGRTLYVQLWTRINGTWLSPQRYTYTAPTGCSAQITAPTPGSMLTSTTTTIAWSAFSGADYYWLDVGNTVGHGDISAGSTTATSQTVNGLPCDGRTLYVQLWTHINGTWLSPQRYTYTAPTGCSAQITAPTPGSVLTSTTTTFAWSAFSGADNYWLDVGNTVGHGDVSAGSTIATSQTVSGLPCDGRTVYVQLWTHSNDTWISPQRYTYTACH